MHGQILCDLCLGTPLVCICPLYFGVSFLKLNIRKRVPSYQEVTGEARAVIHKGAVFLTLKGKFLGRIWP